MDLEEDLTQRSNQKTDHLNHLLTQKIGYGPAQQKLCRPLYLLLFSEGCESIALGLLLPVLTQEWNLSTFDQSMLITVVYLGVAFGSYFQIYSDLYGRYTFITWDAALQCFFGLFSCICWNYTSFLISRFFYGVGIGICLPLSISYITEISPSYMRATILVRSRLSWTIGCIITCFLGYYFLQDNSWRTLLFMICLPGLYAFYQHKTEGRESLRYLWVQKRTDEVYELATMMCQLNNQPHIERQEIETLINQDRGNQETEDVPLSQLFNTKYKPSTIRLLLSWFTVCFIFYGIMLLLPTILQREYSKIHSNSNFKYLFLIAISMVEIVALYITPIMMDHPQIGRKRSVYFGFTIVALATSLIIIFGEENKLSLFVTFLVIKLTICISFMTLNSYTAQIYETMIRGKALGICSLSGRIATTFLGVVGVYAIKWFDGNGLYLIFIFLSLVSGYASYTMPYCTGNKPIG